MMEAYYTVELPWKLILHEVELGT